MDLLSIQVTPQEYFLVGKSKISEGIKYLKNCAQRYNNIPEMMDEIRDYLSSLRRDLQDVESLVQREEPFVSSNLNGINLHHGQEMTQQNAFFGPTLYQESDVVMSSNAQSLLCSKRKRWSQVWEDFTKYVGENGKEWAKCKHCKKEFVGSSKSGTTHLKNHLKSCPDLRTLGRVVDKEENNVIGPDLIGSNLVQRIIKYGLNSMKDDILIVYEQEKCKLRGYLEKLPSCFSLRIKSYIDCWCMGIYFVDDSWKLRKKIIHFNDGHVVYEIMKSVLVEWNIRKKILSVVSCCRELKKAAENLKNWFNKQGLLLFNGTFSDRMSFHDILKNLQYYERTEILANKILVKASSLRGYVNESSNDQEFKCAEEKALSMGKIVASQSVPQIYRGSKSLLKWVVGYKEVFCELEHIDPYFRCINFTKEDWNDAILLYSSWQVLRELEVKITTYRSSTVDFSMVCDFLLRLYQLRKSDNSYLRIIASCCDGCVVEYWRKAGLGLEVSVILDPRCKIEMVKSYYDLIYGIDAEAQFHKTIDDVTKFLSNFVKGSSSFSSSCDHDSTLKLELDYYLKEEDAQDEGFDILQWWRDKSLIYPTLARVARDFLSIHVKCPSLDFPLSDEIKDIFRCTTLDDDLKKKLACTKIWLNTSVNN